MPICEAKDCKANGQEQRLIDGRMGWVCDLHKHMEQIEYLEFPGWKEEAEAPPAKRKPALREEAAPDGVQAEA